MKLTKKDLEQVDQDYITQLNHGQLQHLAATLLADLKEATDRLGMNSKNSSCPPSSNSPWGDDANSTNEEISEEDEGSTGDLTEEDSSDSAVVNSSGKDDKDSDELNPDDEAAREGKGGSGGKNPEGRKNPGKQPGAQGFGRSQILPVSAEFIHKSDTCICCGRLLEKDTPFRALTGKYTIDLAPYEEQKYGLNLVYTKHIYGESTCLCGYKMETLPVRAPLQWEHALQKGRV
jgi:transposase